MAYKWLVRDWKAFFPALDEASTEQDVQRVCEDEIARWRARPTLKKASSLRVPMGDTRAEIKARLEGEKRMWALRYLAFSEAEWIAMNAGGDEAIQQRHENQQFIKDPDVIVAKGTALLSSEQWPDVAVGLAVCTGRRLTEVLKTAQFERKSAYSVLFKGQLKAKGDVTFEIPTLAPAAAVIEAITRLRSQLDTTGIEDRSVSHKYSQTVKEAAHRHFVDLIPTRAGNHEELYTHLFRSIYARIAVLYYCPMNVTDIHFMATIQGHYRLLEITNETDRRNYASSATHYYDYRIVGADGNLDGRQGIRLSMPGVELLEVFKPKPKKEKPTMTTTETQDQQEPKQEGRNVPISVDRATFKREQALKKAKGHRTHAETINLLLDSYEQKGDAQVSQAQLTLTGVIRSVLAQDSSYQKFLNEPSNVAAADLLDRALSERESFNTFLVDALLKEAKFRAGMSTRHADKDFSILPTSQLTKIKHPGATHERIRRVIAAIVAYNDNAQSPNDRWFINPTVVQQLSGARFPIIQEYFAAHQAEIDQENAEHELTPRYNHKPIDGGIKVVITVPEQPYQPATLDILASAE